MSPRNEKRPGGCKTAPDWAWNSRLTTFPECSSKDNSAPIIEDYLRTSDNEFLSQAKQLSKRGVNFVNIPWMFHFRFNHIDKLDKITAVTKRRSY